MVLHDFPWGNHKAPWDVQLTQNDYNLRVKSIDNLNEHENPVAFALCSFKDLAMVSKAYENIGWEGGDYVVVIDKTNKLEKTKQAYGLIEHCQPAVVAFKGPQSEAVWNFTDDPDERKQRWPVVTQKTKQKNEAGQPINFAEQPVEIDSTAISHWSNLGEWVFVDGFGSGTSFIAALREGRSAVGTEPDPVQYLAAVNRVTAAINTMIQADLASIKRRQRQQRLKQAEKKQEEQLAKTKQRKKQQKSKRKKSEEEDEVCLCLFDGFV